MSDEKALFLPARRGGKTLRQTDAMTHALATGQRVVEVTREGTFELSLGEGGKIERTLISDHSGYAGLQKWVDEENRATSAPDGARNHPETPGHPDASD